MVPRGGCGVLHLTRWKSVLEDCQITSTVLCVLSRGNELCFFRVCTQTRRRKVLRKCAVAVQVSRSVVPWKWRLLISPSSEPLLSSIAVGFDP